MWDMRLAREGGRKMKDARGCLGIYSGVDGLGLRICRLKEDDRECNEFDKYYKHCVTSSIFLGSCGSGSYSSRIEDGV